MKIKVTQTLDRMVRVVESVETPQQLSMANDYCQMLISKTVCGFWSNQEMHNMLSWLLRVKQLGVNSVYTNKQHII